MFFILGTIYSLENQQDKAAMEIESAIAIAEKHISNTDIGKISEKEMNSVKDNLASFYVNLGNVELLRNNPVMARFRCQHGESLARNINSKSLLNESIACLDMIAAKYNKV